MTYVPRFTLWGFDVTWIVGTAGMAFYGAVAGCIVGLVLAIVARWLWRRA